jgi:cbb3-type cytochrome oxidase subunit 3
MSKIVERILENVPWLHDLSGITTLLFSLVFIIIVISVLRMRKKDVETYKNIPLDKDNADEM